VIGALKLVLLATGAVLGPTTLMPTPKVPNAVPAPRAHRRAASGAGMSVRYVTAGLVAVMSLVACAAPDVHTDREGLVRVTRVTRADGSVQLRVEPARGELQLNGQSPPRYVTADGVETPLVGTLDAEGEKFVGSAAAVVDRGTGTMLVSVCDTIVGVCRKAVVPIGA